MSEYLKHSITRVPYRFLILVGLLLGILLPLHADDGYRSPDIRFIYLAKWALYEQHYSGDIDLINYGYGAQVFAVADGLVKEAVLSGPVPVGQVSLQDDGDKYPGQNLRFSVEPVQTTEELDRAFPAGCYSFTLHTVTGDYKDHILQLSGAKANFARPPELKLTQCERHINPAMMIPGKDFVISWTDFEIAENDPRGVMDDLIVVKLTDNSGSVIKRSPLPYFSHGPVIRHDARSHVLSGELFEANTTYGIEIEHINVVDSYIREGIPEVAAYVTNTKIAVRTGNGAAQTACEKSDSEL